MKKLDVVGEPTGIRGHATATIRAAQKSSQIGSCSEMVVQDPFGWAGATFGDVFQFSEQGCYWVKLGYKYQGPAVSFLQTAGKRNGQF